VGGGYDSVGEVCKLSPSIYPYYVASIQQQKFFYEIISQQAITKTVQMLNNFDCFWTTTH